MISGIFAALALLALPQAGTRASDGRSYVTGYYQMMLDGVSCGLIQKFEGGDVEADITQIPIQHNYLVAKHLGNLKYNDFVVAMPLSMGKPVHDWVEASLMAKPTRKSGEIKAADFKRQTRHIREFKDALITEIGFPACDAAAKEPSYLTLKFKAWSARNKKGDGSVVDNPADMAQKQWHPTDFEFKIDGLDTSKVMKVEPIKIKQRVTADRNGLKIPGRIEFPSITIYLPAESVKGFTEWNRELAVSGKNSPAKHKSGSLVYLNRSRQKELLTLSFDQLGIFKISAAPRANNQDGPELVKVELTCRSIRL